MLVVDREVKLVPSEFPADGKNPTIGSLPSAHKQTPMTDLGELKNWQRQQSNPSKALCDRNYRNFFFYSGKDL